MKRKNYLHRSLYKKHHGIIPTDDTGRPYDIHHIDGDHTNNVITNLVAVSIQEHYKIHFLQGDWDACLAILVRMESGPDEISAMSKKVQAERIKNNTHHFQKRSDGTSLASDRVKNGTHHLSKRQDGTSMASDRVKSGKCNLSKRPDGTSMSSDRVTNGTHQRLDKNRYVFKNLDSGEEVTMSRKEFMDTYNLHAHQGNLGSMITGRTRVGKKGKVSPVTKHVKRWIVTATIHPTVVGHTVS